MKKQLIIIIFIILVSAAYAIPPGMVPGADNSKIKLFYDPVTASIAIEKENELWFSNPVDRMKDSLANELNLSRLSSQLKVTIYTSNDQKMILDTFSNSVKKGNFKIEKIHDGLRVEYNLNNYERSIEDIPRVVSRERFEKRFLGQMNQNDKELFESRFQLDRSEDVYFHYGIPKFKEKDFLEALDNIGYTEIELIADNEENYAILQQLDGENEINLPGLHLSSREIDRISITLFLIYRLVEDELVVTVDTGKIENDQDYYIQHIEVLEFFGAAGVNEQGYIFIPDGSGALILLNNGKDEYQAYSKRVYGFQEMENPGEMYSEGERISFPVFGLKSNDNALFAVIEDGASIAEINADISGRLNSYNHISAGFHLLEKGKISIGTGNRRRDKIIFPDEIQQGVLSIRYSFISGDKASYLGMSDYYRDYLYKTGDLEDNLIVDSRLNIDLIGAVYHKRSFGGFSFYDPIMMTTVAEVKKIIQHLNSYNISSVNFRYKGWLSGGLHHYSPIRAGLDKHLGTNEEFNELLNTSEERGFSFYPEISLINAYRNGRGFSSARNGVRLLNQEISRSYAFNPATSQRDARFNTGSYLSAADLPDVVDGFISNMDEFEFSGLSINDISLLLADYKKNNPISRNESLNIYREQLKKLEESYIDLSISDPIIPLISYSNRITDLPVESSGNNILDRDIPFNAMVFHGSISHSQLPVNLGNNVNKAVLKAIETGSELSVIWSYEDSSLLKETEFNNNYSTNYEIWSNELLEVFRSIEPFLSLVADLKITEHQEIENGVIKVKYGDDYIALVNYNDYSVELGNLLLEKEDFIILENGGIR